MSSSQFSELLLRFTKSQLPSVYNGLGLAQYERRPKPSSGGGGEPGGAKEGPPAERGSTEEVGLEALGSVPAAEKIHRSEEIPDIRVVLSAEEEEGSESAVLGTDERSDYAFVRTREGEVLFISSARGYLNNKHRWSGLRKLAKETWGTVGHRYTTSSLIRRIYERHESRQAEADQQLQSSDVQREAYDLLADAVARDATDIHIERERNRAQVRYRIHGDLYWQREMAPSEAKNLARVIYETMAAEGSKDTTYKPGEEQAALIDHEINGQEFRFRVNTTPAFPDGSDMVLRVLPVGAEDEVKSLEALGYTERQALEIRRASDRPTGLLLLVGQTGSGKTTTIKHVLMERVENYEGMEKILSIEDPPEYYIPGVTQMPVVRREDKEDEPFARAIRAALRLDPDVINVGEIRDYTTSSLTRQANQSGHLTLGTIHASSGIAAIDRLTSPEIGMPAHVLSSEDFLAAIVYQVLIPTLCPHCSVPYEEASQRGLVAEDVQARLQRAQVATSGIRIRSEEGCEECHGRGVVGRETCAEVLTPNRSMRAHLRNEDMTRLEDAWMASGGTRVLEVAVQKMERGIHDPRDVEHRCLPVDTVVQYEEGRQRERAADPLLTSTDKSLEPQDTQAATAAPMAMRG